MNILHESQWLGNSLFVWLRAAAVGLTVLFAARATLAIVSRHLRRLSEQTTNRLDNHVVEVLVATRWTTLAALGLLAATRALDLPKGVGRRVDQVVMVLWLLQVGIWAATAFEAWLTARRETADPAARTAIGALRFVARTGIWATVLLLALDNLGVDITALVTGLGIGGIAVGLAVQNILGDLFASLSIVLDRPFEIGDFIVIDDLSGEVEHIGVKSTRIRSLTGEQIIFGNSDLLASRIRNYKRMQERRQAFRIGVEYDTAPEALRAIPGWIEEIVAAQPLARFDRAHFAEFGASSLDFEVVYYCKDPAFKALMDTQQAINYALLEKFRLEGVGFAFPTRTLHIAPSEPAKAD